MNAIVKVTGIALLVTAMYSAVASGAALAADPPVVICVAGLDCPEGAPEAEPGPDFDPCQIIDCGPVIANPELPIDPCELVPCGDGGSEVPTPTDEPTPTEEPTPTDEPTPTEQPTPEDEPTPTGEPDPTDTPKTEKLPNAGSGDASAGENHGALALAGLGLAGVGIAGATAWAFRRKRAS